MENILGCIILLLIICGACSIYLILVFFVEWCSKVHLYSFIQNNEGSLKAFISIFLKNGFRWLVKPCKFLISKWNFIDKEIELIHKYLKFQHIESTKIGLLSSSIVCSFLVFCFLSLVFWSFITGFSVVVLCWVCVVIYIRNKNDKYIEKVQEQIPEALRFMSTCLGAGLSINQTFEQMSNSSNKYIANIFKRSTHILKTGGSVSECLKVLENNSNLSELSFVAIALDIQHITGGSINHILDSAKEIAENKLEMSRLLKVKTAQAKLSSKIVIIMPFVLIAFFSIVSPNFLAPFFSSFLGVFVFAVACCMEAAGVIIVRKMLEVNI